MAPITFSVPPEHPAFHGHFPGNPMLPGVSLLAEVIEAVLLDAGLCAAVGPRPRIGVAKFLAPVRPGAVLQLRLLQKPSRVEFEVRQGDRLTAAGHFEPGEPGESGEPGSCAPAEA